MDETYRSREDLLADIEALKRKVAELDTVDAKRELAVAELENQAKLLRKILETMPGGVIVVDEHAQIVLFSPGAESILGVGPADVTPVEWIEKYGARLPDGKTPAAMSDLPLFKALQGGNVDGAEFFVPNPRLKEGLWVSASARPIRGEKGEVRGAVVSLLDVSQRKRAERALRMLLGATREIAEAESLDAAIEAVIRNVCEATGWNYGEAWVPVAESHSLEPSSAWYGNDPRLQKFRAASRTLSFSKGVGLPGRVFETKKPLWIPDLAASAKVFVGRQPLAVELGLRAAAAVPILFEREVIAVLEFFAFESRREDEVWVDQVSHLALQLSNLMASKRTEQALGAARHDVEAAHDLTATTVSGINHVMRQHVAAIIGFSDLIKETDLSPKQREYLDMITRSANEQVEILKKEMKEQAKGE